MSPKRLADVINGLVSDIDKVVIGRRMTKVDTIGDAYIVVGWLTDDEGMIEGGDVHSATRRRCNDMLEVADSILLALERHRASTGIDLHGRIGIATGPVISGVLGR